MGNKPGLPSEDVLHFGDPHWNRVNSEQLHSEPWKSLCLIKIQEQLGTGWLAGGHTVITAAHVVCSGRARIDAPATVIFPASNTQITTTTFFPHLNFTNDPTLDLFDIAVLCLSEPYGERLLFGNPTDSDTLAEIAGFNKEILVTGIGPVTLASDSLLLHKIDTSHGHSGAPVIARSAGQNGSVIGLHISGHEANPYKTKFPDQNVALVMREELTTFVNIYIRKWG